MMLAFAFSDISPEMLVAACGLAFGLVGLLTAYFKHRGMTREANISQALLDGMRVAAIDLASSKDPVTTLEDAVLASAKSYGVHEHVDERMGEGLRPGDIPGPAAPASKTPAPPSGPTRLS